VNNIINHRLEKVSALLEKANQSITELMQSADQISGISSIENGINPAMVGLMVLILAIFVGYYVVWKVTPALHSPLMSVTNAISSVVIVGALIATGQSANPLAQTVGFFAIIIATINIVGGFLVTHRMLAMFDQNKKGK
jgi:H+-translocating NAD(P) transhydrogenase subunit alpha